MNCYRCGNPIKSIHDATVAWWTIPLNRKVRGWFLVHTADWCGDFEASFCGDNDVWIDELASFRCAWDRGDVHSAFILDPDTPGWETIEPVLREAQQQRAYQPHYNQTSGVYILQCKNNYKIGVGRDVGIRVKQIQTASPFDVEHILTIPTPDPYPLESYLHKLFANKRVRGEWFALTDEDLNYIGLIGTDAAFPISPNCINYADTLDELNTPTKSLKPSQIDEDLI